MEQSKVSIYWKEPFKASASYLILPDPIALVSIAFVWSKLTVMIYNKLFYDCVWFIVVLPLLSPQKIGAENKHWIMMAHVNIYICVFQKRAHNRTAASDLAMEDS